MTTVKSIGVLSLGKMMGGLYALFGLLIGGFFALFGLLGLLGGLAASVESSDALGGVFASLVFGAGALLFFPVLYGLFGFLGGLLTALIYNLVAGLFGGVELELVDTAPVAFQPSQPSGGAPARS